MARKVKEATDLMRIIIFPCCAAYSVVSISDFQVKDGVETEEGTGSGVVWDRYLRIPEAHSLVL